MLTFTHILLPRCEPTPARASAATGHTAAPPARHPARCSTPPTPSHPRTLSARACASGSFPTSCIVRHSWSSVSWPGSSGRPVASSASTQPRAHTSAGGPYAAPTSTSGARYHRVVTYLREGTEHVLSHGLQGARLEHELIHCLDGARSGYGLIHCLDGARS
eukprot:358747-Chlamydomonas_euryale.AAC.1